MRIFLAIVAGLFCCYLSWFYEIPISGGLFTAGVVTAIWPHGKENQN